MNRLYYKACSAVILVYDLTKPLSLENLEEWLTEFLDNFQDSDNQTDQTTMSFLVLGNKLDRLQTEFYEEGGSFCTQKLQLSDETYLLKDWPVQQDYRHN